jgi:hypothetical protein
MQNSFLHAASQLISPWFGPSQLWPSPSGWVWPDSLFFFFFEKKPKNPKKFKNPLKKIMIFSNIFLPIFV